MNVESIGNGSPILLIHGWGMHGGVWSDVAKKLAEDFRVHTVDLPGYGFSKAENLEGIRGSKPLESIVAELSANFAEPLTVCGWSLGGKSPCIGQRTNLIKCAA